MSATPSTAKTKRLQELIHRQGKVLCVLHTPTAALSEAEYAQVAAILRAFRRAHFGMLQPDTWHAGFATWCMRDETVRPVVSWQIGRAHV